MKLRIQRLDPDARIPAYAHGPREDAGMDLYALHDLRLEPGVPAMVPTGIAIELPPGYEAQIRPRSGRLTSGAWGFRHDRAERLAGAGRQVFHEDAAGGVVIEGQTGAVHQAEARRRAGNLRDQGGLTETHLADPLAETFVSGQAANPAGETSGELAERHVGLGAGVTQSAGKLIKLRLSFKGNMTLSPEIKSAVS